MANRIKEERTNNQKSDEDCWVLPENWVATMLLMQCKSCWQYSAMGQLLGMDYKAVDVVIERAFDLPVEREDFRRFQVLEHHFIQEING